MSLRKSIQQGWLYLLFILNRSNYYIILPHNMYQLLSKYKKLELDRLGQNFGWSSFRVNHPTLNRVGIRASAIIPSPSMSGHDQQYYGGDQGTLFTIVVI
jgi:hypothetical protein